MTEASKPTIIVVDDDKFFVDTIWMLLQKHGCRHVGAYNRSHGKLLEYGDVSILATDNYASARTKIDEAENVIAVFAATPTKRTKPYGADEKFCSAALDHVAKPKIYTLAARKLHHFVLKGMDAGDEKRLVNLSSPRMQIVPEIMNLLAAYAPPARPETAKNKPAAPGAPTDGPQS